MLGKPYKQVVKDVLRLGLADSPKEQEEPPASEEERPVFEVKPICSGFAPGVDPLKLNQLNAELENEEILRKLRT